MGGRNGAGCRTLRNSRMKLRRAMFVRTAFVADGFYQDQMVW